MAPMGGEIRGSVQDALASWSGVFTLVESQGLGTDPPHQARARDTPPVSPEWLCLHGQKKAE